jgi:hypothetical protein
LIKTKIFFKNLIVYIKFKNLLMNQILYNELVNLARSQQLSSYSQVSPIIGLSMDNELDRNEIARLLREIAIFEQNNGRPMLTSLVIHQGNDNNPGEGYFSIARELGLFNGGRDSIARVTFWANQVTEVYNHWRDSSEFFLYLIPSENDLAWDDPELQCIFELFANNASSSEGFSMLDVNEVSVLIGNFVFNNAQALITAVTAYGVAWLNGKRKLKLKMGDIEIEASNLKEIEALVKLAQDFDNNLSND